MNLYTVTITAIGERAALLEDDGKSLVTEFTGTEAECVTWINQQHPELNGTGRSLRSIAQAAQAWNRSGFADEWELSYRLHP